MACRFKLFTEDLSLWPQLRRLEPDFLARLERFFFCDEICTIGILWTRDGQAYYAKFTNRIELIEVPQWNNAVNVAFMEHEDFPQNYLICVLTKSSSIWTSSWSDPTHPTLFAIHAKQLCHGTSNTSIGHLLVLDHSGGVWAWGDNSCGQLGFGHRENNFAPILLQVNSLIGKGVVEIRANYKISLAYTDRNEIYLWGKIHEETDWTLPRLISTPSHSHIVSFGILGGEFGTDLSVTTLDGKFYRNETLPYRDPWDECPCSEKVIKIHQPEEHNDELCLAFETPSGRFCFDYQLQLGISSVEGSLVDAARYESTPGIVTLTEQALREAGRFNDPNSSDLTVRVEPNTIYVHREVILRKSPFLANFLGNNTRRINLVGHYPVIYSYLRYLYSGRFTDLRDPFAMLRYATHDPDLHRRLIAHIIRLIIRFYRQRYLIDFFWSNREALSQPIYPRQRTQPDETLSARIIRHLLQSLHFGEDLD